MRLIVIIMAILLSASHPVFARHGYAAIDSINVVGWLAEARLLPPSTCYPVFFAKKFLGVPYVAHTLEVNDEEQLVINTRQLDCTTLVENVVALTLCMRNGKYSFKDYLHYIYIIRYRNGCNQGYTSRLHYFTEWIDDNSEKGIVSERQTPNPPFSAVQTVRLGYMSAHPDKYKALRLHPDYIKGIREVERQYSGKKYRYVPKSSVRKGTALRKAVKNGDIIAITCNKKGLDIAHLGIAVWKKDGLHLLNASQIHKKVVLEPMLLGEYLYKHPSHTGIRIVEIL